MLSLRASGAALSSLLAVSCGARDALPIAGSDVTGGPGVTGPSSCDGAPALAVTATIDPTKGVSEPVSTLRLAWTGTKLFIAWTHSAAGGDELAVAAVQVAGGTLAVGKTALVAAGNTSNPYNPLIAWSGADLGLFWAQDDGSILLQRFDAGLVALGAPVPAIMPSGGVQTIPTGILGGGGRYLLTWGVQQPDLGWHTFVASLNEDGTILGGPTLLYADSFIAYAGALLAQGGGRTVAVWQQQPQPNDPSMGATWFASIDPTSGAVLAAETVEQGVTHLASAVALEAHGDDVAVHYWDDPRTVIFSRPQAGGAFSERASLPAPTPASLAVTPCGRLVALVPTGALIPDNLLATGLLVQPIGVQGVEGAPLSLPVGGDHVESWDIAAVDGGLVVAWVEASSAQSPERTGHMAYVQMP